MRVVAIVDEGFVEPTPPPEYSYTNLTVKTGKDGDVVEGLDSYFDMGSSRNLYMTATLIDENETVPEDLTLGQFKLVATRCADNIPTTDEVYLMATLVEGQLTVEGAFERGGNWKILLTRNNKALARNPLVVQAGLMFKVIGKDFDFVM